MLKGPAGALVYSPSDLIRFMESPFSSWMDRYHLEFPGQLVPDEDSAEQKLIQETGNRHEQRFLDSLKVAGRDIAEMDRRSKGAEVDTRAAMAAGHGVIYQGCLSFTPFRGFTDFLMRVEPGPDNRPRYEVWDTKLARKAKPYYLVQLCCYAEMLEHAQGWRPHTLRVVLGNNEIPKFNTEDFFYYYRQLKQAFLTQMAGFDPRTPPLPEARAEHGRWQSYADRKLIEIDHLSQVARISVGQIKKLNAAGIATVAQLAKTKPQRILGIGLPIAERLVEQAQLQVETAGLRAQAAPGLFIPPLYRILPPDLAHPRQGLALLPPPSPNDLFFDMEGFPLVDGGLEYLFGVTYREGGALQFADWWAHDPAEEKTAFESFIDWAFAKWKADPSLHIFHYAQYEVTALRRLMGRHGTREDMLDDLLRNGVFVDLFKITQQGLRIGEPSYSIKFVEHLYRGQRAGDVQDAGQSIVYYANWIESGEPRDWRRSSILEKIRSYNRDDCDSTCQLRDWLLTQQRQAGIAYAASPAKPPATEPDPEKAEGLARRAALVFSLQNKLNREADPDRRTIHEMILNLLEFHRRESKPVWWRMFDRAEQDPATLEDDIACIGGARLSAEPPVPDKRSLVFTFHFNPEQDTKIAEGNRVRALPNLTATMEVVFIDDETGEIRVKLSSKVLQEQFAGALPAVTSFIPDEFVSPAPLAAAVERLAFAWDQHGSIPPALRQLLLRQPPSLAGGDQTLRRTGESAVAAAVRCAGSIRNSTLCIQGPPGTGKTYTAARAILALLSVGKNVGVTSNSHKAIENLLRECHAQAGGAVGCLYVTNNPSEELSAQCPGLEVSDSARAHGRYHGGLVAGTAWLFTRPEWEGQLDHLFIDEAGQVSLANGAAMSTSTENLVLIGDQMQLEQPVQGSHPGESGLSALDYYLDGHSTVPESLGLFLAETRRLHPDICRFISDLVYDGRLKAIAGNENLRIEQPASAKFVRVNSGILFSPVEHDGNTQASDEELMRIQAITRELLGRRKIGRDGRPNGVVQIEDILFVAPYNMQVRRLRSGLLTGARVGSVDKFQGQEADVVILSMCSSFGEYGSRGLEFILDRNRMNVALSRARILAVVVGDPRIATTPAHSIDAMRRINLYCRLLQECGAI